MQTFVICINSLKFIKIYKINMDGLNYNRGILSNFVCLPIQCPSSVLCKLGSWIDAGKWVS